MFVSQKRKGRGKEDGRAKEGRSAFIATGRDRQNGRRKEEEEEQKINFKGRIFLSLSFSPQEIEVDSLGRLDLKPGILSIHPCSSSSQK